MTNTMSYAKRELSILRQTVPDAILLEFEEEVLALCEKFGQSGQSGGSAPYVASILSSSLRKLLMFEPIAPVTGDESEWVDVTHYNDGTPLYQNSRAFSVFKEGINGRAYDTDAIIKRCPDGSTWHGWFWKSKEDYLTGNKDLMIRPMGYIKSFPYEPKTFYIDVIEEEVAPDDWEMYCADPKQLEEVWEYFDPF